MNRSHSLLAAAFVAVALSVASPARAGDEHTSHALSFDQFVPGAAELEGRIIAPCCWTQTIDIHGSELSTELRQEIRRRLLAGESADVIERSLVERYGARVLAVPPGSRLGGVGVALGLTLLGAGIGAFMLLRRWQQRSAPVTAPEAPAAAGPRDAELDARVDAELSRLDGE
ncbi:MAG: cytochrome c-type biogenesis protein CcmH [Polyangiaceae bacterium]